VDESGRCAGAVAGDRGYDGAGEGDRPPDRQPPAGSGAQEAGAAESSQRLKLRQTYEREAPGLARKAGRHAHARQFKRMRRVLRRQRTLLGRVIRDIGRQLDRMAGAARDLMQVWLERAERIRSQQPKDKNKLYALHAAEVECIGKGKARKPYGFGVKVGSAVTARQGLVVGARSFAG